MERGRMKPHIISSMAYPNNKRRTIKIKSIFSDKNNYVHTHTNEVIVNLMHVIDNNISVRNWHPFGYVKKHEDSIEVALDMLRFINRSIIPYVQYSRYVEIMKECKNILLSTTPTEPKVEVEDWETRKRRIFHTFGVLLKPGI